MRRRLLHACLRAFPRDLRERDFEEVEHYGGVSPAWPISYADLEPYYAEAEQLSPRAWLQGGRQCQHIFVFRGVDEPRDDDAHECLAGNEAG